MNWTLTPSVDGAYITRNSSIGTDITWEWDYDPLEASNLTMYATWRNTCAIRDDGDVYCWGRNGNGQLGIGSMGSSHWKDRPTNTNNLGSDAISVSMGEQHTCAVLDTGVLKCWGRNHHGQVGDGSTTDRSAPQTINVGSGRTTTSVYMGSITRVPSLTTNLSSAGEGTRTENLEWALQRAVSIHHKLSILLEQIAMRYRLHWVKVSRVHFSMMVRSSAGVKTMKGNVAMVVDTVAISVHRQVQPISLPDRSNCNTNLCWSIPCLRPPR